MYTPTEMETQQNKELGKLVQDSGTPDFMISQQSPSQMLLERLKELRKYQEQQREELQQQIRSRMLVTPDFPCHSGIVKKLNVGSPEIHLEEDSLHTYPDKLCDAAPEVPRTESGVLHTSLSKPSAMETHRENCKEKGQYESEYTSSFSSHDASDSCLVPQSQKLMATLPSEMTDSEFHVTPEGGDELNGDAVLPLINSGAKLQACSPPKSDGICYSAGGFEQIESEKLESRKYYQSEKYKLDSEIQVDILSSGKLESDFSLKSNNTTSGSHFALSGRGFGRNTVAEPDNAPKVKHKFLRKGEGTARFRMKPVKLKNPAAVAEGKSEKLGSPIKTQATENMNGLRPQNDVSRELSTVQSGKFVPRMPVKELKVKTVASKVSRTVGHEIDSNLGSKSQESRISISSKSPLQVSAQNVDFDKQSFRDQEELLAFEKLEELADDSSFSSNSSTIWQLLKRGQQSAASTPLRSPAPFSPQGTPIFNQRNEQRFALENSCNESQNVVDISVNSPSPHEVIPQSKPRVYFSNEVVSKEYEVSETEDDDTLTNTDSILNDDSALFTTSDFEELVLLHMQKSAQGLPQAAMLTSEKQRTEYLDEDTGEVADSEGDNSSSDTLTPVVPKKGKGLQPVALQFSPPPYRSADTASDYIESIFGKIKDAKCKPKKVMTNKAEKNLERPHKSCHENAETAAFCPEPQVEHKEDEIETYKTLLVAKISELEKETKIFQRENSKLQNLVQATQEEKQQLVSERQKLQEETARERKRFEEYVDKERNAIWKEKQKLNHHPSPTISEAKEHSLEIVYLKEQIHDLREELKKKESLAQFNIRKLNDKIKALEEENKQLKNANLSLQNLEKANLQLKHELDRLKLGRKSAVANQPGNLRGKQMSNVKTATVNFVNRSLGQMKRNNEKRTVDHFRTNTNLCLSKNKHTDFDLDSGSHSTEVAPVSHDKEKFPVNEKLPFPSDSVEQKTEPESRLGANYSQTVSLQKAVLVGQDTTDITDTQKQNDRADMKNHNVPLPCEDMNMESYETVREDGTREITYANGNKKEIFPDGVIIVNYFNNDRKEIYEDRTVYVYGTDRTSHTTFNDGKEVYIFPSGQKETRYLDGSSEIIFADNSQRITFKDGTEVCKTKDGTVIRTNPDGSKVFEFTSGQKEIHLDGEKRREYPDGTVKILHRDGKTETRYKSGRIRMKDPKGNILIDTHEGVG